MTRRHRLTALSTLILIPLTAFAAGSSLTTTGSPWTGPYVGAQIGLNQSSAYDWSTETSFSGGILGGYNVALPIRTAPVPIILGGDVFLNFNSQARHTPPVNYGSNVFGVDFMAGYPVGYNQALLPYLKVGVGDVNATGDLSGGNTTARVGLGAQYRLQPNLDLAVQWMHQDARHITNDNFTVGLNYRFPAQ